MVTGSGVMGTARGINSTMIKACGGVRSAMISNCGGIRNTMINNCAGVRSGFISRCLAGSNRAMRRTGTELGGTWYYLHVRQTSSFIAGVPGDFKTPFFL